MAQPLKPSCIGGHQERGSSICVHIAFGATPIPARAAESSRTWVHDFDCQSISFQAVFTVLPVRVLGAIISLLRWLYSPRAHGRKALSVAPYSLCPNYAPWLRVFDCFLLCVYCCITSCRAVS